MGTKQRLQIDSGLRPQEVRPVASPVDTYAQQDAGRKLAGLAAGLAQFAPSLSRFAAVKQESDDEDAKARGIQAARQLQEQRISYADAVKRGLISREKNPFFLLGYKEQYGRASAEQWAADFRASVQQDEHLKSSTNMDDFYAAAQKHQAEWMKANVDPAQRDRPFENGFGFRRDAYLSGMAQEFANGIDQKIKTKADEALHAETKLYTLNHLGSMSPDQIASDLSGMLNDRIGLTGMDPEQANRTVGRALLAAAFESPDGGKVAMEVWKKMTGKDGALLSATSYGSEIVQQLAQVIDHNNDREWTMGQRDKQQRTEAISTEAIARLAKDPHANLADLVLRGKDLPEVVGILKGLQNGVSDLTFNTTNEQVKQSLQRGIILREGVTRSQIMAEMGRRNLSSQDAQFLVNLIEEQEQKDQSDGGRTKDLLQSPVLRDELNNLKPRLIELIGKTTGPGDALSDAEVSIKTMWLDYMAKNPNADQQTQMKWLKETADLVVERLRRNSGFSLSLHAPGGVVTDRKELEAEKNLPKEPVVSTTDLARFRAEMAAGKVSPQTLALLQKYGLTVQMLPKFARTQQSLLNSAAAASVKPND